MSKDNRLQKWLDELQNTLHQWLGAIENTDYPAALHQRLKGLTESARAAGHVELSVRAHRIQVQMTPLLTDSNPSTQNAMQAAVALSDLLAWWGAENPQKNVVTRSTQGRNPFGETSEAAPIYLVNSNAFLAEDTAMQLRYFGYTVVVLHTIDVLAAAIAEREPAAVVVDFEYREDILVKIAKIAHARPNDHRYFPIALISTRGNFKARLSAVRAGADCYFTKPVDVVGLTDRLDALILSKDKQPFRLLLISDDTETANDYNEMLRHAGMQTLLLQQPPDIFKTFDDYRPELVLMDVSTPSCTGTDLAKLIRQNNIYIDVPIVFLSSDNSLPKRLEAINAGADDFLAKPLDPLHFVASVASRADRYRALRSLIMRDSLTGLYNHSAVKEYLVREVSSSDRTQAPVTLAMIDLDFFKRINDTYGHPVGDQVIRALSRLLQQRLRRGDVIGRYGGEEFAVILPGTPATAALGVLDQIREAFSKIRHHADDCEFTSTFSAGLADITKHETAEALFRGADAALYEAKHKGRNCIEIG